MATQTATEREATASEPRVLHAVVEDKLQRSGRMELRRRLLEAIVSGRETVSWEWKDKRLRSTYFRQDVDLQYPAPDEDWPSEGARCLFDLWTDDVGYLARWPREAKQAAGSFTFRIEECLVPVRASYAHTNDAERVDIELEEVPTRAQEAAKRALQWHDEYRLGHCPVSPFKEQSPSQPPNPRSTIWAFLPAICITALLAALAIASFAAFAWPIVVGSFVWGLTAVPLSGWLALNSYAALSIPDEYARLAAFQATARRRAWSAGLLIVLFFAALLLPAIVAGVWLREPEAVSLAIATFFGFMMFIWGGLLFHHSRREPDVEPL
ncbi:MAG: hypothetical protein WD894_19480 [Pirellulales bacterium]